MEDIRLVPIPPILVKILSAHIVEYGDADGGLYAAELQRSGLDEVTARFVATLDVALAHGDLETDSTGLADLLGHPATSPVEVVHAAYDLVKITSRTAVIGLTGAGRIGGALAQLAVGAGHHVALSNSRGPATLSGLAARLGPRNSTLPQASRPHGTSRSR